jgi:hypothetical protein
MLQIRSDHMSALAEQQMSGFVSRMAAHLREVFPEEASRLSDPDLVVFVEKVCSQGEIWEIPNEDHLERLLELFLCFSELRRQPPPEWLQTLVTSPEYTGERRLCMIEDHLIFGAGA